MFGWYPSNDSYIVYTRTTGPVDHYMSIWMPSQPLDLLYDGDIQEELS